MASAKLRPSERRIKKYQREDPKFDPIAYRKAFYRAGHQIALIKRKGEGK